MATESETTWTNLLKIMFKPGNLRAAMPDNFLLYNWLHDRAGGIVPYGGSEIRFPVKNQKQAGIGAVATGASSLPTATISNSLLAKFNVRYVYGVGEIDDMVMEISRSSDFAYEQATQQTRQDLLVSLKQVINAAWYDDGRCRLGVFPAADDQQTITLSQPILAMQGQRFDVIDATDDSTELLSGATVDAINHQGVANNLLQGTLTYSESAISGSAASDYLVPENWIAAGTQLGPFGIRAGCTSANPSLENYGQINRTTGGNEAWQGNRLHNSAVNRAWRVSLATAMLNLIRRRSSQMIDLEDVRIVNDRNLTQEIFEQVATDQQIVTRGKEALTISTGFKGGSGKSFQPYGMLHGVNPMIQDESAPANVQFFLTPNTWHITETGPPKLVDEDGAVLHRFEGRGAYQFRYRYFHEVYTTTPSANGILEDLQVTNPAA